MLAINVEESVSFRLLDDEIYLRLVLNPNFRNQLTIQRNTTKVI